MTESRIRQEPVARAASRSAMISACAVGSWRSSRSLPPAPITSPSRTTTAPIGTSSCSRARSASRRASRMKNSSRAKNRSPIRSDRIMPRRAPLALAAAAALVFPAGASAAGKVVVGYRDGHTTVFRSADPAAAIARARARPTVAYAVPDVVAHASQATPPPQSPLPDDPGRGTAPGGWQDVQWNFLASGFGIDAPAAWQHAAAAGHPGASGVTVAVLDTGVAYKASGRFKRDPDLAGTRFVRGF